MQLFARFFSPFLQLFAGWLYAVAPALRTEEATDCTGMGKSVQQSEKSVSPAGKRRWTTEQPSIILKVLE